LLEDVYKGVTYLLDEDAYADAENEDVVRKRFIKGWEPLVEGYRVSKWSMLNRLLEKRADSSYDLRRRASLIRISRRSSR
jgi:hypothetical protein